MKRTQYAKISCEYCKQKQKKCDNLTNCARCKRRKIACIRIGRFPNIIKMRKKILELVIENVDLKQELDMYRKTN